jgi:heme-degrading monooxygenase HmoA
LTHRRNAPNITGEEATMIVEMAILEAKAGQADQLRHGLRKAREVISQSPGYLGSVFHQAIERPERIVLYIQWESVAAHTEGFRKGPLFSEWRSHWAEHMAGSPDVLHYEIFAGET